MYNKVLREKAKELGLRVRDIKFFHEYFVDNNGLQAAIRAGFPHKGANTQAQRLLHSDAGRAYMETMIDERSKVCAIDKQLIIDGLTKVYRKAMQAEPVMEYDRVAREYVQVTEEQDLYDEDGNFVRTRQVDVWKHDSAAALKALELLGKAVGAFTEKIDITSGGKQVSWANALSAMPDELEPKPQRPELPPSEEDIQEGEVVQSDNSSEVEDDEDDYSE